MIRTRAGEITASKIPRMIWTARREPKELQAAVQATVIPHRHTLKPRTLSAENFWRSVPVRRTSNRIQN